VTFEGTQSELHSHQIFEGSSSVHLKSLISCELTLVILKYNITAILRLKHSLGETGENNELHQSGEWTATDPDSIMEPSENNLVIVTKQRYSMLPNQYKLHTTL
jgi:hypothetical protein